MHELSIAQAVIDQAVEAAQKEKADRISGITLTIGALSGVDRGSLEFVFPLAAEKTRAEGAQLTIEETPAKVTCRACGATTKPRMPLLSCAKCKSQDVEITAGRELYLKSVELVTQD